MFFSQLIRSAARASSYVNYLNNQNKISTVKLLKQEYCYHELRETFSNLVTFILN